MTESRPEKSRVRLDKWLWAARFFKTRTLAALEITRGKVRIDGQTLKASHEVRVGERLQIMRGEEKWEVRVHALSIQRGPAAFAQQLYSELPESELRRKTLAQLKSEVAEPADGIKGRPTKRDGRKLRRATDGS